MLPKPCSDNIHRSNFCPISLLNVDIKNLTKILACRLNSCIGTLIHPDQVGFMPSRQASDRIRKVTNLIHISKQRWIAAMVLSVDIKKAFDLVLWPANKWGQVEGASRRRN